MRNLRELSNTLEQDVEQLLTEKQVAHRQQRSIKTLQNQRVTGAGIPFLKLGSLVRYHLSDVIAWEDARTAHSTSETSAHSRQPYRVADIRALIGDLDRSSYQPPTDTTSRKPTSGERS